MFILRPPPTTKEEDFLLCYLFHYFGTYYILALHNIEHKLFEQKYKGVKPPPPPCFSLYFFSLILTWWNSRKINQKLLSFTLGGCVFLSLVKIKKRIQWEKRSAPRKKKNLRFLYVHTVGTLSAHNIRLSPKEIEEEYLL